MRTLSTALAGLLTRSPTAPAINPTPDALDEVHLPQRPAAIKRTRHDASDKFTKLGFGAGFRQRRSPHVVGNVEALVINPYGVRQASRNPPNTLTKARNQGDSATNQLHESVVVKTFFRRLEDRHAADMHGCGRLFQVEK